MHLRDAEEIERSGDVIGELYHGVGAGDGIAAAVSAHIEAQSLHANFESRGEGLFAGGVFSNGRRDVDLDTITARLSYKWGGDCCAPVPMK